VLRGSAQHCVKGNTTEGEVTHMPIYEYQCNQCKAVFDCVLLKYDEQFKPECKKCGSADVQKLISRTRYLSGPREDGLAECAEKKMLSKLGSNVSDSMKQEIKQLSQTAAKRGKKRFEKMLDTGSSEAEDY
jgi:putative FmdB family regulatory protein